MIVSTPVYLPRALGVGILPADVIYNRDPEYDPTGLAESYNLAQDPGAYAQLGMFYNETFEIVVDLPFELTNFQGQSLDATDIRFPLAQSVSGGQTSFTLRGPMLDGPNSFDEPLAGKSFAYFFAALGTSAVYVLAVGSYHLAHASVEPPVFKARSMQTGASGSRRVVFK